MCASLPRPPSPGGGRTLKKESAFEPLVYAWKFALAAAATFARSSTMYTVLGLGAIPFPTAGVLDIFVVVSEWEWEAGPGGVRAG
jgi:hypothetical protein